MPRRTDLRSVLVIGSGPIVIGQACEFDYAGTQAVKALRSEGVQVVLLNSNPATIMTDPELAHATYVEPLTLEVLDQILARERPDAVLPTLGGQTALNLGLAAERTGALARHRVELIGVTASSIEMAEDRAQFKAAMDRIGLSCPRSQQAESVEAAVRIAAELGYPVVLRPSFTMGGSGGGIAHDESRLRHMAAFALDQSPTRQVLIEESVLGWKEFELEVVRDARDNCVIVCSIENVDPMGVHTGDSITVAPAMTLTDKEYQRMRDAAFAVVREIGVTTGGANVQFALDPATGRLLVIEMNPRVSRSSALASKATGFPIAKIAAKLAIGYTLDELDNDITKVTPASFEPTLDYVVVKWPRFAFEKFPGARTELGPQMRSVGEAMAVGRTFREALGKAMRSLETGRAGFDQSFGIRDDLGALCRAIATPTGDRMFQLGRAFQLGLTIETARDATGIDPWFLHHIRAIALAELELAAKALGATTSGIALDGLDAAPPPITGLAAVADHLRSYKRLGFSDRRIAALIGTTEQQIRQARHAAGVHPIYKRIDTCSAEFEAHTQYFYSSYEDECEAKPTTRRKVIILGGGPNRIGQGIEFDYCCVHAAIALQTDGIESIMVNCNPETVSTDYDTSDRLYFEPVTLEDVLEICAVEHPAGVIIQLGGQTPLKLAAGLAAAGVPILGTQPDAIDRAEDRQRFGAVLAKLGLQAPAWGTANSLAEAREIAQAIGFPVMVRPSYVLGGRAMERIDNVAALDGYFRSISIATKGQQTAVDRESATVGLPILIDKFLVDAIEVDVDVVADHTGAVMIGGVMEHIESAGIHSGDSACALPPYSLARSIVEEIERQAIAIAKELEVVGLMNAQFAVFRGELFVLEVNPRASRTIPFVSKAVGISLAQVATRAMLGTSLRDQGIAQPAANAVSVKEVVLPFIKFDGVDPRLGPEMRSTGEVMGIGDDFAVAFAKSQLAASNPLPTTGRVLLAIAELEDAVMIGRRFIALGMELVAPPALAPRLSERGVVVTATSEHVLEQVSLAIVIDGGAVNHREAQALRRATLIQRISYVTTVRGAHAAADAIAAMQRAPMSVRPLQRRPEPRDV
ncbi:MAG: carbamoyl-phosphate synthase large subunit [Kofleriaceae bacterium]